MNTDVINDHYYGDLSHPTTQRCRQRIHWICQQAKGRRVLEVGCSQGITCILLGREGFECTGVDIEHAAITRARHDLEKEAVQVQERVKYLQADAAKLPFEDGHFDTVLLCEVLEHLTHPQKILLEIRRVLQDGGKVVITVPYGLLAHQDHKRTFYHHSLLETVQPFFRTTLIEALHSKQLVYCGLKDRSYDCNKLSAESLLPIHLAWERGLEERCTSVEWSVLQTSQELGAKIKSLSEQLNRLKEDAKKQNKLLAAKDDQLGLLQAAELAKEQRIRDLEPSLEQERTLAAAMRDLAARADAAHAASIQKLEEMLAAKEKRTQELQKSLEEARHAVMGLQEASRRIEAEQVSAQSEAASLRASLTALNSQLTTLQTENTALRQAVTAKEEAFLELRADATNATSALAAARQQSQAVETECAALRQELSAKDASLARGHTEASAAGAALAAAQQEVLSLRAEAAELQKKLTAQQASWQQQFAEQEQVHLARLKDRERQFRQCSVEQEAGWTRRAANQRVREVAHAALPADAQVLVISKGDDDLLQLDGRHGWHFPQTTGGVYAGYHPANSADAIAHLETLKAKGAQFLLIPSSAFWWLDFYADFRQHLERQCMLVTYQENICCIFSLSPAAVQGKLHPRFSSPGTADQSPAPLASTSIAVPKVPAASSPAPAHAPASAAAAKPSQGRPIVDTPPPPASNRKHPSASLVVGAILDEFTTACFAPQCSLVTFRPDNWKAVIEHTPIDMLFVESAWRGNDGAWQYKIVSVPRGDELCDLVRHCRAKGIPTVFWNKEDPAHFDRFIKSASLFDCVFTTDSDCVPNYHEHLQHERTFALPFAAQSKIHHPILNTERLHNVCFAGAYYGLNHDERCNDMDLILKPALEYGLHIFDRQHGVVGAAANQYRFPDIYQHAIKGRLDYSHMVKAYKRYKVFMNVNSIKTSPTMFSRRVFELLACGTPVISAYARGIENLLGADVVALSTSEDETKRHLDRLLNHETEWARASTRGIRAVFDHHTYAHRWHELCQHVKPICAAPCAKTVTAIAVLSKGTNLRHLTSVLTGQTYRHFTVRLYLEKGLAASVVEPLANALPDVAVEVSSGVEDLPAACAHIDSGDYLWLIQAGDFYGGNFLKDLMLAATYSDAEIIGKHTHFVPSKNGGGLELTSPGYEYRHVNSLPPGSLIIKRGVLAEAAWDGLLRRQTLQTTQHQVLSIDRFNYVRNAYPAAESQANHNAAALKQAIV